jgi:S-adenosylmethionine decarboxylase
LIDAAGCSPEALKDPRTLAALFEHLIRQMSLKVIGTPQWHVFPSPGGITGLALLAESHLGIHTFPEHGFAALNLYCCKEREAPDFVELARRYLGAQQCDVRVVLRGGNLL